MNSETNIANKYSPVTTTQYLGRCLCVLYYCAAIPALINSPLILTNNHYAFAMGIPLSLCSLVAVWSMLSSRSLLLRFAVTIFVTSICWHALTQLVWWGSGDPASAAWAFSTFLQMLIVMGTIHFAGVHKFLRCNDAGEHQSRQSSKLTFDLRTLGLWTTTSAIVFLFIQYSAQRHEWNGNQRIWPHLTAMAWVGLLNATCALACLWVSQQNGYRMQVLRCLAVAILTLAASMVLPTLMSLTCETQILSRGEAISLLSSQLANLLVAFCLFSKFEAPQSQPHKTLSTVSKQP